MKRMVLIAVAMMIVAPHAALAAMEKRLGQECEVAVPVTALTFADWLKQYPREQRPGFYKVHECGQGGQQKCVDPSPAAQVMYKKYRKQSADERGPSFAGWLEKHPEQCDARWEGVDGKEYMLPKEGARQTYAAQNPQEHD